MIRFEYNLVRYYQSTAPVFLWPLLSCRHQSRQFSSSSGLHSGSSKDRRCRTGRPRQTWLRTVEDDLRPLNFGLAIATRSALDRSTIDMAAIQCICMIVSTWMLTCSGERGGSEEPVRFWLSMHHHPVSKQWYRVFRLQLMIRSTKKQLDKNDLQKITLIRTEAVVAVLKKDEKFVGGPMYPLGCRLTRAQSQGCRLLNTKFTDYSLIFMVFVGIVDIGFRLDSYWIRWIGLCMRIM